MMKDIISTINMHPLRDSYIEDGINSLINRYLLENNQTLESPIDLTELLEFSLKYEVKFENIKQLYSVLKDFEGDILGCTDFERKEVIIDKDLYENNLKRANFTLAHEISHIVFHEKHYSRYKLQLNFDFSKKDQPSFVCRDYKNTNSKRPIIEQQADKGASFLLMPRPLLLNEWQNIKENYANLLETGIKDDQEEYIIKKLAEDFSEPLQVSKQALEFRIKNLGVDFFGFMKEGASRQMGLFV